MEAGNRIIMKHIHTLGNRIVFVALSMLLVCALNATAQQKKKQSYPKNSEKIENVRGNFRTCTLGACYSGWNILLKSPDQLLFQWSVHHPPTQTRYSDSGTWRINSDTLHLEILSESFNQSFMFKTYRIARDEEFQLDLLLPFDNKTDWDTTLKAIKSKFLESEDYKSFKELEMPQRIIREQFTNFLLWEYGEKLKLLVGELK
jgi:hypothetical protein